MLDPVSDTLAWVSAPRSRPTATDRIPQRPSKSHSRATRVT